MSTPARTAARPHRSVRRDRTSGVAAVEAAIVLPLVITLFLGIVEFGLVFKDLLAMSSGVRAGGRMASAEPLKLSFAADAAAQVAGSVSAVNLSGAATLYVYDPDATSDPVGSCVTRCVSYDWNGTTFDPNTSAWDRCAGKDSLKVGVLLVVHHQGVTSLPFASPTLTEKAVFAFEPASTTAICQ